MKPSTPHLFAVAFFGLAALLVGGCSFTQDKNDAEAVLTRHFQTISTNDFDTAMTDYGTQFFEKTPKDEWTKALAKLIGKLGTYQSHTLTACAHIQEGRHERSGHHRFASVRGYVFQAPGDGKFYTFQGFERFGLHDCRTQHQLDSLIGRVSMMRIMRADSGGGWGAGINALQPAAAERRGCVGISAAAPRERGQHCRMVFTTAPPAATTHTRPHRQAPPHGACSPLRQCGAPRPSRRSSHRPPAPTAEPDRAC